MVDCARPVISWTFRVVIFFLIIGSLLAIDSFEMVEETAKPHCGFASFMPFRIPQAERIELFLLDRPLGGTCLAQAVLDLQRDRTHKTYAREWDSTRPRA